MSNFFNRKRKILRAIHNEHDRATIVSIYPREVKEHNPTIRPGDFTIPPGTPEKPSTLVVGSSSWFTTETEDRPIQEIPIYAISVAQSVVMDFAGSLLGASAPDIMPGLFFLPGEVSVVDVLKKHKDLIDAAKERQILWYKELVQIADIDWARTNGNPISISNESRRAAIELNLKDRPWMQDFKTVQLVPCKFCGTLKNEMFPICQNCKQVTDLVRAKELGLVEAVSKVS